MANHDLVLGQNSDLALGKHHNLVIGQSHGLVGHFHDHDLGLRHPHDSQLVLGHYNHHDHNELSLGQTHDSDDVALAPQNRDLGLLDSHGFPLAEPHELTIDQNIDQMVVYHAQELALQPANEMPQSSLVASRNHHLLLTVGQEFADVKSCRRALRDTAISCHFEIQTVKSDKTRCTAKCAAKGCPWRVHAAKLPGVPTFTIRTINETHTCSLINSLLHHQASVPENPLYKPNEAWRGKERITVASPGSFDEAYRLLPQYCKQIRSTNQGSIALVYGNPEDNCFQRLFISFYASIYNFVNACFPLIGLDRITLKSKYLGALLLATGYDGDGALFPLAFGVVNEETDENWIWFLSELHALLEANTENMPRLTILSDRQKGIVDGVEFNFPTAFHGFCMRHLSDSFRKEFSNTLLVNLLWEAAHALTIIEFEAKILEIEETSLEAACWIRRIPPRLWATAYFEGTRYGHLTANLVELLNNWVLEASALPIIQMMECIRRQLMTWFNERHEISSHWSTILVPSVERRVSEAVERARGYQVGRANEAEFEVASPIEGLNIVDIRNRCCLCRGWQIYGLPCAHGVAALLYCRQNVHRYAESCFTVATYRKTYSQTVHPIPDKSLWKELSGQDGGDGEEMVINPPNCVRPPARPRKKRVRAEERGAAKRVVHCSRCNQTGHFRTTCAAPT